MQLTTLENVKSWLDIGPEDTSADTKLTLLIGAASGWVEKQCRRTFDQTTQKETFSGTRVRGYSPKRTPVTAVVAVIVDGITLDAADYIVVDDRVELINDKFFNEGRFNCSVEYTAGFAEVPPAVEQATRMLVCEAYRGRDRIGLQSRSFASGEAVVFRPDQIPPTVQSVIDLYREMVVP